MKKSVIIAILYTIIIVTGPGCSEDKKRNLGYFGYTPLVEDLTKTKSVLPGKAYTFNNATINEICSGSQCNAIIFQGAGGIFGPNYIGFAVNDKHDVSPDFKLKVYWLGNSIPTSVTNFTPVKHPDPLTSTSQYILIVEKNGKIYANPSGNLNLTISQGSTDPGNPLYHQYTITFNSLITANNYNSTSSVTINNGNSVVAQKHP